MPSAVQNTMKPRKQPVQARSAASVDAVLEATLQVLLQVGKQRLTTTRVAARAGVSVDTLYQYFPNKGALLQATLRRHFDDVVAVVQRVCREQHGHTLSQMAEAIATGFLQAKLKDGKTGVALYAVASDVDGVAIAQTMGQQTYEAICTMLETASDGPLREPALVTQIVQATRSGVSRQLLERADPARDFEPFCKALVSLLRGYLAEAARTEP